MREEICCLDATEPAARPHGGLTMTLYGAEAGPCLAPIERERTSTILRREVMTGLRAR